MTAAPPHRIEIVPWGQPKTISGFTFTRSQVNNTLGGGYARQNGTANSHDGDYVEWDVLLDSGTWAIDVIYTKSGSYGFVDFLFNGVLAGTYDGYNASTSYNNTTTISGILVDSVGYYTLKALVNGKNALSSDYQFNLQLIVLRRTGD